MNQAVKDVLAEARERVGELIFSWSRSGKDRLDVVTLPQNKADIFIKTIEGAVAEGWSILYITDEKDSIRLLESIKKCSGFKGYSHLRSYDRGQLDQLTVCSTATARLVEETFDLVIYDEINSLPGYSDSEIVGLVESRTRAGGKCIIYSVGSKFKNGEVILLPIGDRKAPMTEPREIITRIDISSDIPFAAYDYIKWSLSSGRNVLIYVPDGDKAEKVFGYIGRYCADKCSSVSCYIRGESDAKVLENFFVRKKSIMVTDELEKTSVAAAETDIMVLFAGDTRFSSKILVHLAARVVKLERNDMGEVVFLCNESCVNVEAAKGMIRRLNREAWELGLLRA